MNSKTSAFLDELGQQPAALRRLARYYRGEGRALLLNWARRARKAGRVVFSGMGTSEYVPGLLTQALGSKGIGMVILEAGEWDHYFTPLKGLTVLISQSGESAETRNLAKNKSLRGRTIAVTNNPQSSLARASQTVLPLLAGAES